MINITQNKNQYQVKQNVLNFKKPAFGKIIQSDTKDRPIVMVTDAWWPHICGPTKATSAIASTLAKKGYNVQVIAQQGKFSEDFSHKSEKAESPHHPDGFRGITSKKIYGKNLKVCIGPFNEKRMRNMLAESNPSAVYCATEGPLGWYTKWSLNPEQTKISYMTSYLTSWPEYAEDNTKFWINKNLKRIGLDSNKLTEKIPEGAKDFVSRALKKFHAAAPKVMVTTKTLKQDLTAKGIDEEKITIIPRGTHIDSYKPDLKDENFKFVDSANPEKNVSGKDGQLIIGYVGRVSPEKNIEELLKLSNEKDKRINKGNYKVVVVGPPSSDEYMKDLRKKYPEAIFTGPKKEDLPEHYANMDIFAFPSLTDTFGIVLLEAMASGVPIAAHNVPGPADVLDREIIGDETVGHLENDLGEAIAKTAWDLEERPDEIRQNCVNCVTENYTWDKVADKFVDTLDMIDEKALQETLGVNPARKDLGKIA